jgi:cytochrome c-type biogenesis protein CcmF
MHYLIGDLGHFFVLLSAVSAAFTFFIYLKASRAEEGLVRNQWLVNGRVGFYIHSLSLLGVIAALFSIIYNHYFEYHYAYSHSSRHLPVYYMISCFWEGQEGSFLLWMFWQAVLGLILIRTQRAWEGPVMSIFSLVQAFLGSMIMGVVIPGLDLKLGSSPFILLRDAIQDPIFISNPDFIPADGNGLNPLLQNYWMVIHPPTLFLGFAATLVPFSFCLAGLYFGKFTEWVKPALPWSLFGGAVLGIGILMGGYWAYETLSFGGYWNWDPVENAVYVPWLILIASIHTLMLYKAKKRGLRTSVILVIGVFILILYSTFLTRSGILGDASVHSFTDLGLSGQLLVYLLVFTAAAVFAVIWRWKQLPATDQELDTYSSEFWIFLGAAVLCLMGFQVLIPTSFPVINKVAGFFGISSAMAPPADQVGFYSRLQLWFAVAAAMLSGLAQFFWWGRIRRQYSLKPVLIPLLVSALISLIFINIYKIFRIDFVCLMFSGVFIIVSNTIMLASVLRKKPLISGGAVTHIGVGLMLIGILFSSGYSKVVSLNNSGLLISKSASTEFNRDNLLLFINEPRTMAGYDIEYRGDRILDNASGEFLRKSEIFLTEDPYRVTAKTLITREGKELYNPGDTIDINPENTYYEIELKQEGKLAARLFPRVQMNPSMGMLSSPDITRGFKSDLYTHVSASVSTGDPQDVEWSKPEEVTVKIGEEFFVNDYVASIEKVQPVTEIGGIQLQPDDVAAMATIKIQGEYETYTSSPVFLIRNASGDAAVGYLPDEVSDLGVKLTLNNILPKEEKFTVGITTRQKDWVIIKAMEKPFINILWLGTGLLSIGFVMAMVRRFREFGEKA